MNALEEIKEIFLAAAGWADRYNHIVELAGRLPVMPERLKTPANRIDCQSTVYFSASLNGIRLRVHAYANTAIPAGLASLLVDLFNDLPVAELQPTLDALSSFLVSSGLLDNLTAPRRAALTEMIRRLLHVV
jgi:sulfur transfer protein SufE